MAKKGVDEKAGFPIIRSNASDVSWMFGLAAALATYRSAEKPLGHRIKVVNGGETVRTIIKLMECIMDQLMLTFPREKRAAMARQAQHLYFHIDVCKPVIDENNGHYYLAARDVDTLIDAAHEQCKLCSHPAGCSRCQLGKTLDAVVPQSRGAKESWATIDVSLE